jgi:hypothetical protein
MAVYPNGLGENGVGDVLASAAPIYIGGSSGAAIWWVNSTSPYAADAGGIAGQDRERPLLTLAQAVTNAAAGDIIVLQAGHTETRTAALAIAKALTIVGIGKIGSKPAAQLLNNSAAASLLTITAPVELRNIYFPANLQLNTAAKISFSTASAGCRVVDCYVECSVNDNNAGISIANNTADVTLEGTTVISTAASSSNRPGYGIRLGTGIGTLVTNGLTLSGGPFGWNSGAFVCDGGVSRVRCVNVSLLLGATMSMSASVGWVHVQEATGMARVDWT